MSSGIGLQCRAIQCAITGRGSPTLLPAKAGSGLDFVGEVVHAMHDPTEGGLATGLLELVAPASLGLRISREHIPVFPETDTICSALRLDPLTVIASGALLIAVAPDGADSVLTAVEATGVPVVTIGEVHPSSEGITIVTNGAVEPLTPQLETRSREPSKAVSARPPRRLNGR